MKKTYICKYCLRKITKDFRTKNGCRWCDTKYHAKLLGKNMKGIPVKNLFEKLREERKKHPIYYFFHDLYYRIYNFITDLNWKIPNYFERAYYGVGHSDIWGFDIYLTRIIIRGIKQLKKNIHGVPLDIGDKYENNFKKAMQEWQSILDKIIRAFEIHLLWEDYARFPTKKERKQYEEGWELFKEYFGNLWD